MFSKLIRDKSKLPIFVRDLPSDGTSKLALFDADGTLWTDDVADDFTQHAIETKLLKHGHLWQEYLNVYANNPTAGCPFLLKLYRGVSEEDFSAAVKEWWLHHSKRNWVIEVMESLYYLAEQNYTIWVVTGSPTAVMLPLLEDLPIDKIIGIDFELDHEGLITGEVEGICCSGQGKADKVLSLWDHGEILFSCGNSSMDIPMMELSKKITWSIYPNDIFLKEAKEKDWIITPRPSHFREENKFES